MAAPGCWPKSWQYEIRGEAHIVVAVAPNGIETRITARRNERQAEDEVATRIQHALDSELHPIAPDALNLCDKIGIKVVRECRQFWTTRGDSVEVWSRRRAVLRDATIIGNVTESVPDIERAIYLEGGYTAAAGELLRKSLPPMEEPRTSTVNRG